MREKFLFALGVSLILTIALETLFFVLAKKRGKKDLLLLVMVNVITNPAVVSLYWLIALNASRNPAAIKIPLEFFAVFTEGYHYKKYGKNFGRPYLFSAAANAFSFFAGAIILKFI